MPSARTAVPRRLTVGGHLSVEDALAGARRPHVLRFAPGARRRVDASARRIREAVARSEWVYGVTTGFGSNATVMVAERDAEALQVNLLTSHAFGEGDTPADVFPDEVVRLALLLRVHALALGASGVRWQTLRSLSRLYEEDVLAVVPARGSVGASGDLAPLAFLALPLIGRGRVRWKGSVRDAADALSEAGLEPARLSYKEGLALVNGMQVTLAVALLALEAAERALLAADLAAALTFEALAGRRAALDPRIHEARHHPGQRASAARIRALLEDSRLVDAPVEEIPGKRRAPQDAYGIRCAPQVHGACADGIAFAREVFTREIDAATDNPLVFGEDVLSGGNFHGEPLALASDHLKLCIHELGSISERRTATLVDGHMSEGLPPYLSPKTGIHSGFMIPQYVAAALVSEAKTLCFPASADSIPTGANIEDHVSMGTTAARRALEVSRLVESVLSIEILAAAQAIELRALPAGPRARAVVAALRRTVPFRGEDGPWDDALAKTRRLVADGTLLAAAGLGAPSRPRARARGGR